MIIKKVEILSSGQKVGRCSVNDTREFTGLKVEYHPWQMLNLVGVVFEQDGLLVLHENQNRIHAGFEDKLITDEGTYISYNNKEVGSQMKLVNSNTPLMTVERIEQFQDGGMYFHCWWYDARQIIRRAWFHDDEIEKK